MDAGADTQRAHGRTVPQGTPDFGEFAGQLATKAKDAAYVAVGLGVLGLQRAQAARHRVAAQAVETDERLAKVSTALGAGAQQLGEWLESTVSFVGSSLKPLEEQLPGSAREMADKALAQLHAWREQARQSGWPRA